MSKDKNAPAAMPAKLHRPAHEVPDFDAVFGEDVSGLTCVSNADLDSPEGRLRYQAALERASIQTKSLLVEKFDVVWFFVFRVESRNDDQEVTGAHYRIVFMNLGGETYETHSDTAIRTLRNWIAVHGWKAWSPAVSFGIEQKQGTSGRTYHQLRIVSKNHKPLAAE